MRALFCDMCGAQIKSLPAHFNTGSPAIVNERMEIIDGGDFDLCHDCAGKVAAFIHAAASEKAAEQAQKEQAQ